MPLENWEEEGLAKIPNLDISQWRFLLTTERHKDSTKVKNDLLEAIKSESKMIAYLSLTLLYCSATQVRRLPKFVTCIF